MYSSNLSHSEINHKIKTAHERIRGHVAETALISSPRLSAQLVSSVYLKLENRQITGSFKLRGATNKLLSLSTQERSRGVVTASSGNHGLAVAHAAAALGIPAAIYLPESASPEKVAKLRALAADLHFVPGDPLNGEVTARRVAQETGRAFISPYNDPEVIAGQGTVGVELLAQRPNLDAVFVSVGGGGLISGVAAYLKAERPEIAIIGCLPLNSPVMAESVRAGEIVEMESLPTLSDGTAGGIEPGAITFPFCQTLVDSWILVTEEQIADGVRLMHGLHGERVEGSAGVAVAALLTDAARWRGKTVAAILCGGNIPEPLFREIVGDPPNEEAES
jgi:threonine dehydratase